jgi:catechol 2,3-dioxygenase-like lactoylglutathione lyase family enzyme
MMALELYMLGLIVQDMGRSLEFYRRLGLAIPEGSEGKPHVQVKMGSMTFFLDSKPSLWDPSFSRNGDSGREEAQPYRSVLEFYLKTGAAVEAKYAELTGLGYEGYRAPYKTSFGMCFALIKDPDGNTLLLSGDLEEHAAAQAG